MNIIKLEGIILNEKNYSESSKILDLYTKEYGKIGIISKGCRRIKSNLRSVSSNLIYGDFNIYYKENGLSTLISVDVKNRFKNIMTDINKISYVSFICDLANQITREKDFDGLFDLLISSILKIEDGFNPLVITNICELKCLEYLGVKPVLDECSVCGNTHAVTLSSDKGGYVCSECKNHNDRMMSEKAIKLIKMFYYVDISKISKLDISDSVSKEIDIFINEYYERWTGLYLKSKKFVDSLKKLNN